MIPLDETEVGALHAALDDEYQAWATYDQVVRDFGEVRPFVAIREAEARHIAALARLFERHALPMPDNPWTGRVPRFGSVRQACEAGLAAEVSNAALYDRLLAATRRPDILAVFRSLRDASQLRHLPAFERCARREGTGGGGPGRGRGRGQGRGHGGCQ